MWKTKKKQKSNVLNGWMQKLNSEPECNLCMRSIRVKCFFTNKDRHGGKQFSAETIDETKRPNINYTKQKHLLLRLRALSAREFSVSSKNRMRNINATYKEEREKIRSNSPVFVVCFVVCETGPGSGWSTSKTVAAWLKLDSRWFGSSSLFFPRNARPNHATVSNVDASIVCWDVKIRSAVARLRTGIAVV